MSRYTIARLDEIEEVDDGRCKWRPVRHHLGVTSFGINSWTGRNVGDRIINEHDEDEPDGNEELYFVAQGRARFEIDGDSVDAPAGTFVLVPPEPTRTAFAEEPETTLVAIGGVPGKAYVSDGWELWAPLRPLYEAGDYEAVIERSRPLIEAHPEYPDLVYNLACCESLAGHKDEAVAHLRQAVERSERARALAKEDSDFDPIRDEPAFKELIAG
jgi:tetratricopeptide (TPR) repeat protein